MGWDQGARHKTAPPGAHSCWEVPLWRPGRRRKTPVQRSHQPRQQSSCPWTPPRGSQRIGAGPRNRQMFCHCRRRKQPRRVAGVQVRPVGTTNGPLTYPKAVQVTVDIYTPAYAPSLTRWVSVLGGHWFPDAGIPATLRSAWRARRSTTVVLR